MSLQQKSEVLKAPQCPICFQKYNQKQKLPYYICKNSHSICRQCYGQYSRTSTTCPICKCQMNLNYRQNTDILALIKMQKFYEKNQKIIEAMKINSSKASNTLISQKIELPRFIQLGLFLIGCCIFPLFFIFISQVSHIIILLEEGIYIFTRNILLNFINFMWKFFNTFIESLHNTCETLLVYHLLKYIWYVIHLLLITFILVFFLKWGAQKIVQSQWNQKNKNLVQLQVPKNLIEKYSFIVLIKFLTITQICFLPKEG